MPIYNASLTHIDKSETKRYAGLSKVVFDEKLIEHACLEAQLLSQAKGIWQIYDYNHSTHTIEAEVPANIKGKVVQRHLQNATKIIVLAVTIGEDIENAVTNHFKANNYTHSILLDAAATTAVEMAADTMEKTIKQYIEAKGYQTIMRFSPGYGDWDITFQPEMLRLSSAQEIGITLTSSMMLIPRKSVTAVIGLVPNCDGSALQTSHDCKSCNKLDCLARKESSI